MASNGVIGGSKHQGGGDRESETWKFGNATKSSFQPRIDVHNRTSSGQVDDLLKLSDFELNSSDDQSTETTTIDTGRGSKSATGKTLKVELQQLETIEKQSEEIKELHKQLSEFKRQQPHLQQKTLVTELQRQTASPTGVRTATTSTTAAVPSAPPLPLFPSLKEFEPNVRYESEELAREKVKSETLDKRVATLESELLLHRRLLQEVEEKVASSPSSGQNLELLQQERSSKKRTQYLINFSKELQTQVDFLKAQITADKEDFGKERKEKLQLLAANKRITSQNNSLTAERRELYDRIQRLELSLSNEKEKNRVVNQKLTRMISAAHSSRQTFETLDEVVPPPPYTTEFEPSANSIGYQTAVAIEALSSEQGATKSPWTCSHCTFLNEDSQRRCQVCEKSKPL